MEYSKLLDVINNISDSLGDYEVIYRIKFLGFNIDKKRNVKIVDTINPIISITGDDTIYLCPGVEYEEAGYTAYDEYDGDITDNVNVIKQDDKIIYEVYDKSLNKSSVVRNIIYNDSEGPQITLNGTSKVYVAKGSKYIEQGIKVIDNCDDDITIITTGKVDINKVGTYKITYEAKDKFGNTSKLIRDVIVYNNTNTNKNNTDKKGIIYLTFDDGPKAGNTNKILDILAKYNVKATFFVTNQYNSSTYLIKREYEEGHAIGLHTYSHQYSQIYTSIDAYFKDLDKISDVVYNLIGIRPKIIRFPGGSSNTVSKNYSKGIMTALASEVKNRGYRYFDWNVCGEDAGKCSTSSCVYKNVVNNLSKNRANFVLLHDTKTTTLNALEDIIKYALNNNYTFEVITESSPTSAHRINN